MSDPLRLMWDTLAARGCRPHGKEFDFRARCPAHDGDNPSSLHVAAGADGRAVLWCFAHGCEAEAIVAALGLGMHDLFPAGHYRARRLSAPNVKRSDFRGSAQGVATALYALEQLQQPWTLMLTSDCPYCGSQGAWLRADAGGRVDVDCPEGCDATNYTQALLAQLRERRSA